MEKVIQSRVSKLVGVLVAIAIAASTLSSCSNSGELGQPSASETQSSAVVSQDESAETEAKAAKESPQIPAKGLSFTMDELVARVPDLKPMESLGEFKTSQKFAYDFGDGSGTMVGEYLKDGKTILHLNIIGNGPTYSHAVGMAMLLAMTANDDDKSLLNKLSSQDLNDYSTVSKDIEYTFKTIQNQQAFFLRNIADPQLSQEQLRQEYVNPNIGISLKGFKSNFNRAARSINKKLMLKGKGEETTSPTYEIYNITKDTIMHLQTSDKFMLEQIEVDGIPTESKLFWQATEAAISALYPAKPKSVVTSILKILGGSRTSNPPSDKEFDIDNYHFQVVNISEPPAYSLTIQSNKP